MLVDAIRQDVDATSSCTDDNIFGGAQVPQVDASMSAMS